MNRRDRAVIRVCDWVLLLASDPTRAQVKVALLRARHRMVPPALLERADFPSTRDRTP